jgi:hypothetical protein
MPDNLSPLCAVGAALYFLTIEAVSKPHANLGLPVFTASPQLNLTAKAQRVFTGNFAFCRQFVCFASVQ